MLEFNGINYWAVAIVWLIYVVVGAVWYSPAGFGKQWTRHTKVDLLKFPPKEAKKIIGFVMLSALVQALTLAVILNSLNAVEGIEGLKVGLLLWFGLVTATTVGVTLYSKRSWSFLLLNSSYFLTVMVPASIILAAWQ